MALLQFVTIYIDVIVPITFQFDKYFDHVQITIMLNKVDFLVTVFYNSIKQFCVSHLATCLQKNRRTVYYRLSEVDSSDITNQKTICCFNVESSVFIILPIQWI